MVLQPTGSRASDVKPTDTHVDDKLDINEEQAIREELATAIKPQDADLYAEALAKYGVDGDIDPAEEKRVRRKLDRRIIPILGICEYPCYVYSLTSGYFFYYVDKTTLSYAAIFGIKEDLKLHPTDYNWLSSIFYFGWLFWAIPSNLLMQRSPPAYYLGFNICMWGVLLMCQAAVNNFGGLAALRVLGGAFEAIADPAFVRSPPSLGDFAYVRCSSPPCSTPAPSNHHAFRRGTSGTASALLVVV